MEEVKKRKTRRVLNPDAKLLKEVKLTNKKLDKVIELLNNIWTEKTP